LTGRKPNTQRFERRLTLSVTCACALLGVVVARLIQVQVVEAGPLRREARSQQERTLELPAARGSIQDREGNPLAITVPADRRGTRGPDRLHPNGSLASQVIGCCSPDGRGIEGIELVFQENLEGRPGERVVGANAKGQRFTTPSGQVRPPVDGSDVILTIDSAAQSVLERELERCVNKSDAASATAILMDPKTGDVLALGTYPSYDPDQHWRFDAGCRKNRAITDINEPGSTFKLITVAACLEEGVATRRTLIESAKELELPGGLPLRDKKDYGWVSVDETLTLSVNTATARLARMLGRDTLFEYARSFGFGCVTGIDLPGEASGILRRPAHWSGRSLETIAIGQEVAVTPIQLAAAYGVVANGGVLVKPRIVKEVRDPSGRTVREFRPQRVRRVLSETTAEALTEILVAVVEEGTGQEARIPGVSVAGKTGTAQRVNPETGKYDPDKHVSSFVGFLPAEDPQLVAVVVVDRPRGVGYGGHVAAPCFRRIVEGTILRSREPTVLGRSRPGHPARET
jgi:cell division protein FtsI (penicillin-binding protein 3)